MASYPQHLRPFVFDRPPPATSRERLTTPSESRFWARVLRHEVKCKMQQTRLRGRHADAGMDNPLTITR